MTTFPYTGSQQTFTVPTGASEVEITVLGAGVSPSKGGSATGRLSVTGGETLYVYAGGASGWNGGGIGNGPEGVNGAGASDVRQGGSALADRVIVAGGSGGGGYDGNGGYGGGANGGTGGYNQVGTGG